ncbi:hypothetical protein D3C72_1199770 [compost metagenome]
MKTLSELLRSKVVLPVSNLFTSLVRALSDKASRTWQRLWLVVVLEPWQALRSAALRAVLSVGWLAQAWLARLSSLVRTLADKFRKDNR